VPLLRRGNKMQQRLAGGFAESGSPYFYAVAFTVILALFGNIGHITPE
jgi:hypothetical protein